MFKPGDRVRNKRNPKKVGTVIEILEQGPTGIRFKILLDSIEYVEWKDKAMELLPDKEETTFELLKSFKFSGVEDLRLAITRMRLSGKVDNFIYSLNLTNTRFLAYQFKPLISFLKSRNNSLLIADEVGLGKTIESGLIWTELEMRRNAKRLLVVCPAVLCEKWQLELSDKFNVVADIVNAKTLLEKIKLIQNNRIRQVALIVSLQGVRPERGWEDDKEGSPRSELAKFLSDTDPTDDVFDLIILDEAHSIRNIETQSNKFIHLIKGFCRHMLMLSATPIQTDTSDLFSLLNVLAPSEFPSESSVELVINNNIEIIRLCDQLSRRSIEQHEFVEHIKKLLLNSYGQRKEELQSWIATPPTEKKLKTERGRSELISELRNIHPLFQVVSRTQKRDVQEERVLREVASYVVKPTRAELNLYNLITSEIIDFCKENNTPPGFATIMPQRLISSSPQGAFDHWQKERSDNTEEYLQELNLETESTPLRERIKKAICSFTETEELFQEDSKFEKLMEALGHYWSNHPKKKVLLFSFFKTTLKRLKKQLESRGIKTVRYDGDIPKEERREIIDKFKDDDNLILLSSEIAAEGIDLQFMNCIVNYDLPWNPAKIEQRIGRIDRIGQESPKIYILNMIHEETVDCLIYERLFKRLGIFENALGLSEDILGKTILELTKKLFSRNLTKTEQEKVIDQTRFALENLALNKENLAGQSMVYDLIEKEINKAKEMERFITDEDLLNYIETYLEKEGSGSRIICVNENERLFEARLSSSVRAGFDDFMEKMGNSLPSSRLLEHNPILKIRIRNKIGKELDGSIERITQTHPFIQYITHWFHNEKIKTGKTVAFKISRSLLTEKYSSEIKPGKYFFGINSWIQTDEVGQSVTLATFVYSVDKQQALSEEAAEFLIHKGSMQGRDWPSTIVKQSFSSEELTSYFDEAENHLDNGFDKFKIEKERSFNNDIEFLLAQLAQEEKQAQLQYDTHMQNDVVEKGLLGRQKRYKNVLDRKLAEIDLKRKRAETRKESFQLSNNVLVRGVLEIE